MIERVNMLDSGSADSLIYTDPLDMNSGGMLCDSSRDT